MRKLLFHILALLLLTGCDGATSNKAEKESVYATESNVAAQLGESVMLKVPDYQVIHDQQYNEFARELPKEVLVIKEQTTYEAKLKERSTEKALAIDFTRETLLLLDMGVQMSGGNSIEVDSVEAIENNVVFNIRYIFNGPNCMATMALTNPYKIIKVQTTNIIVIRESQSMRHC